MKHAKPVTFNRWGIEAMSGGTPRLESRIDDKDGPYMTDTRKDARALLAIWKDLGLADKGRVVRLSVTVKVKQ